MGGKVASWVVPGGNHVEMGLHVFFGCYHNLFRLMAKCGVLQNLLKKQHTHTFVNKGGDVRDLDFRFEVGGAKIGAPFHGLKAFFTTPQLSTIDKLANSLALGTSPIVRSLVDPEGGMADIRALDGVSFADWFRSHGGSQASIDRMWDPIAYALGFLDCEDISARCMLTIFQFFATKTDASVLRMLNGSPAERLLKPITDYIEARGGKIHLRTGCREIVWREDAATGELEVTGMRFTRAGRERFVEADAYVAALDVPGAKALLPSAWRAKHEEFDKIHSLVGVPVITVQLRYDGWVTELGDGGVKSAKECREARGLDNLLYSADADFSCFADLALTSPRGVLQGGAREPAPVRAHAGGPLHAALERGDRRQGPRAGRQALPVGRAVQPAADLVVRRQGRRSPSTARPPGWTSTGPTSRRPSSACSWPARTRSRTTSTRWKGRRCPGGLCAGKVLKQAKELAGAPR